MKWNRQERKKLHIHTTSRDLRSEPPRTRGGLPYLAVALIIMFFVTKYIAPDWWLPSPEDYRPLTVPIERGPVVEITPDPPEEVVTTPPAEEKPVHIPVWQQYAVPSELIPGRAYVAIVIDDMGVNIPKSREMLEMPAVLTLSFLPYARNVAEMAQAARTKGHELMVHIPMEPMDGTLNSGENVLLTSMTSEELRQTITANLDKFTGYVGINNHMGSRFTQDEAALAELANVLKERELTLLDSKTIASSKAFSIARDMGVPSAERDVFLDDDPTLPAVRKQLAHLEKVALAKGSAIAIGHPKADTIAALKEWLPLAEAKGIQIVPFSALISRD